VANFPAGSRVTVGPFVHRREGESATIGDLERGVFVTIPAAGLEILDALAAGETVREVTRRYERTHGETPDIEDFLTALAAKGFVTRFQSEARLSWAHTPAGVPRVGRRRVALGRHIFGVSALVGYATLVCLGAVLVASDPRLIPGPRALVFHQQVATLLVAVFALSFAGVLVHETGHVFAAWACGVPARIRLGHRLWVLVAETEMSGVWLVPKRSRYLAFLAGVIVDAVSAAVLIVLLWTFRRGWIGLSPTVVQLSRAVLFTYLLRLLWQCFVFVRTDFYYVLATALDCKRLLADTEDLLRNRLARLRGVAQKVDQSAIPSAEMRAIRAYSGVWLGGRMLALGSLALITLPVLAGYGAELSRATTGAHARYGTVDILIAALLGIAIQGGGLLTWVVSLCRNQSRAPGVGGPVKSPSPSSVVIPARDRGGA
jgi:putative peptide zinc metalloprotease protein